MIHFGIEYIHTVQHGHNLQDNWLTKGENPLRRTTQDKKGLVFTAIIFYPIF